MKVASILKVRNEKITLLWLQVLPIRISKKQIEMVVRKSKGKKYILWTLRKGIRYF